MVSKKVGLILRIVLVVVLVGLLVLGFFMRGNVVDDGGGEDGEDSYIVDSVAAETVAGVEPVAEVKSLAEVESVTGIESVAEVESVV